MEAATIALLFPGQGAQGVGMGQALCQSHSIAAERFAEASELLGYDLAKLCREGPADTLHATVHCQPALFVSSIAALEVLRVEKPEWLERVGGAAGLSLGEYTAVCFAGAMSFADGVRLVQRRGAAMQAAADCVESGMASVLGVDAAPLQALCEEALAAGGNEGEVLQLANLLCPGNIAVSGHRSALARLEPLALAAGAMKVVPLSVAGAFHTPLMQPAVESLRSALDAVTFRPATIPIWSNVDGKPHTDPSEIRLLLARQVVAPVLWEALIRDMLSAGIAGFVEVGTGKVLRGILKRIDRKLPAEGFGD
jgi:[acyl-carrier-protein] S-malonyltransferase